MVRRKNFKTDAAYRAYLDADEKDMLPVGRDKLIIESAKHLAGTDEDGKLLAFLAEQAKEYKANVMPLYPSDSVLMDFEPYDVAKNSFFESLWDAVQQHFDDLGQGQE